MGLIEKWNEFAKKKIIINDNYVIGAGRLVYMGLITIFQMVSILILTGDFSAVFPLLSNFIFAIEKKYDTEIDD